MLLLADVFDMRQYRRAAVAHELHLSAILAAAERNDTTDRLGRFERDVEKDEIGYAARQRLMHPLAIGELLGIDA